MTQSVETARFTVDHMVTKLGKYLRILGLDATWDACARTHELISRANREGRVFLTRNRHIDSRYPEPQRLLVLESTDPVAQLYQVIAAYDLDTRRGLFSKCIRCNVALETVADKRSIESCVHPNVYRRHAEFYTCPVCGTVFWKGSHVRNTLAKLHLADG